MGDFEDGGWLSRAWTRTVVVTAGILAALFAIAALVLLICGYWHVRTRDTGAASPISAARTFADSGGDYGSIRHFRQLYALAEQVKEAIPADSRIYVSANIGPYTRLRYFLKPELVVSPSPKQWDYYLDTDGSLAAPPAGGKKVLITPEPGAAPVPLYGAPGMPLAPGVTVGKPASRRGIVGAAARFDGVADTLVVPAARLHDLLGAGKDFSIAFWWRCETVPFPDGYRALVTAYAPETGGVVLYQRGNPEGTSQRIYMNFYTAGEGRPVLDPAVGLADDYAGWHHYVFQREGETFRAWCDGSLQDSYSAPAVREVILAELRVSPPESGGTGALDELRIYARALPEAEIRALHATPAEAAAAELHLPMDEVATSPNTEAAGPVAADSPKNVPDNTLRSVMWFVILQGLNLIGGCFLLVLLRGQAGGTLHGYAYSLAMAYVLGFLWNNLLLMVLGVIRVPLGPLVVLGCYLSLPVLLVALVHRSEVLRLFVPPLGRLKKWTWAELSLSLVFGTVAVSQYLWVAVASVLEPRYRWDTISHWLPKARIIHGFDGFFFTETHHNEYPILWPLSVAAHFFFTGYHADYIAYWLVALFLAAMLLILYHGARTLGLGPGAGTAGIAVFFIFFYDDFLVSAYAESLFTLLFAACVVVVLARFVQRVPNAGDYLLLALLFVGLTLTKFEGHLAVFIIGVAWVLAFPFADRRLWHWAAWIVLVVACMLPQYGWIAWQRHHGFLSGYTTQLGAGPPDRARFSVWLDGAVDYFLNAAPQQQLFFVVIALATLFALRTLVRRRDFLALLLLTTGMFAFSFVSLLGWKTETVPSGFTTVIPRLYLHYTPAVFLLCMVVVSEWRARTVREVALEELCATPPSTGGESRVPEPW